ncbi:MAG TPA: SprT family protein [Candidatus Limosilactobacillus faecipullorum]|nr:SprT family protein [Candidatus Limosilactobacillus faecipullorum]
MTNEELQRLAQQWSLSAFSKPINHPVIFNRRLRTTGGRYHLQDHHIDINPLMYEEFDLANLKRVVLHELCHYHLHLAGMGYRHRDADFKRLLTAVGGSRYAPAISRRRGLKPQRIIYYQCQQCGEIIQRKRRFNTVRYVCAKCGGKFLIKKIEKV